MEAGCGLRVAKVLGAAGVGAIRGAAGAPRGPPGLPAVDSESLSRVARTEGSRALPLVAAVPVTKGLKLFSQRRDLLFQLAHLPAWTSLLLLAGLPPPPYLWRLDGGPPSALREAPAARSSQGQALPAEKAVSGQALPTGWLWPTTVLLSNGAAIGDQGGRLVGLRRVLLRRREWWRLCVCLAF